MAWTTLAEADVLTVLSGPELAAYRTKALAEGQDDPLEASIAQITFLVRGHVATCGRHRLGAGNSIPEELRAPALDLIAYRMSQRVGLTPAPGRRELSIAAMAVLERVADGHLSIAPPEVADTTAPDGPAPTLAAVTPTFGRHREDGV